MPLPPTETEQAGSRALLIGRCELALGDKAAARTAFDQGRTQIADALKHVPADAAYTRAELYTDSAYVEAWSGSRDAALRSIDKAIALAIDDFKKYIPSESSEAAIFQADSFYKGKAEIQAHLGDAEGATDILRRLLAVEGTGNTISIPLLQIDPVWDPIRDDPRFQALR
jgi:serine/threonine-protein kinase